MRVRLDHARVINRSHRKRVAGRKRHAETDKASSANGTGDDTSDASIISIIFRPSDENKRGGSLLHALSPNHFFLASALRAVRPADRIDSHRSGLDTLSPFLAISSDLTIPCRTGTYTCRHERIFVRDADEKALSLHFQDPLFSGRSLILFELDRLFRSLTLSTTIYFALWFSGD